MNANKTKRGWSVTQDSILRDLILQNSQQRLRWVDVAIVLQSRTGRYRTGKQCRQRWQHQLNPAISKDELTVQQQNYLYQLQKLYGNKWALIAEHMPGRTDNGIKNFFYAAIRRVINKVNLYMVRQRKRKQFKSIRQFEAEFLSKLLAVVDGNYDKRIKLISLQTIMLAKEILAKIVNLTNQMSANIQLQIIDERLDELIEMMNQFRRNCKKRKQKRRDQKEERQFQEESLVQDSSGRKSSWIIESSSSSSQVVSKQSHIKIQKKPSIVTEEQKMINQADDEMNEVMTAQKLTFNSDSKRQTQTFINSICTWPDVALNQMVGKQSIVDIPLLKSFSAIREQPKDRYWDILDPMSAANIAIGLERSEIIEEDWNQGDQNYRFPIFQSEDTLGMSQPYDSSQIVTKLKMYEASLALEQLELNSKKQSRVQYNATQDPNS